MNLSTRHTSANAMTSWNTAYNMTQSLSAQPVRMGIYSVPCGGTYARVMNQKQYELKDHLGNVRVTFSDRKEPQDCDNLGDGWVAVATSVNNYYSFGMLQPGRNWNAGNYRFGFNGKENDNEVKGVGNSVDFGARIYDSRLGRWLSVDPLQNKYPWASPYSACSSNPIWYYDADGRDVVVSVYTPTQGASTGHMALYVTTYEEVKIKVVENGMTVTKTYYTPNGTAYIQNLPNEKGSATSVSTDINIVRNSFVRSTVDYKVHEVSGGQYGSEFDPKLNPTLDPQKLYYTYEEIADEKAIYDEANGLAKSTANQYAHGDGKNLDNQNDCSSLIVDLLIVGKIIKESQKGLFATTVVVDGQNYSFYTPNQIGIALKAYPGVIMDKSAFSNMTSENAKTYLKNRILLEKKENSSQSNNSDDSGSFKK